MRTTLLLLLFLTAAPSVRAGWLFDHRSGKLVYPATPAGDESLQAVLKGLSEGKQLHTISGIYAPGLIHEEPFQAEIFTILQRRAPEKLGAALKSAGNMHNPKMSDLRPPFETAVLETRTVQEISATLAGYGMRVSGVSLEKLELRQTERGHRFWCLLWLSIAKSPN